VILRKNLREISSLRLDNVVKSAANSIGKYDIPREKFNIIWKAPLDGFKLLSLRLCYSIMPYRGTIFQDRSDDYTVVVKKVCTGQSCSFEWL